MKKTITMILAIMLLTVGTLGISVKAATQKITNGSVDFERGDAQITITGNEGQSLEGKKFQIYRLFDAENAVNEESINYKFNPDFKSALQKTVGKQLGITMLEDVTEYEVIDYIQSLNKNQVEGAKTSQTEEGRYSEFRYFVEELRNEIVNQGIEGDIVQVESTNDYNSFTIKGLEYGYYVIDEITSAAGTHQAVSLCMVNTANQNADVSIKSDYPTVVNKIQEDDNQELIGNEGWNDIGDYEIGQDVPYKMESKIPNINGYSTYYWAFHGSMDKAFTLQDKTVQIVLSGTFGETDKQYTLLETEFHLTTDSVDNTFKIEIEDIKTIIDREFSNKNENKENIYGQEIVLTYKASLNDNAAVDLGRPGFENDGRIEFSNNPNQGSEDETGFTPWDTVVCYSYQLNGLKVNNYGTPLENAVFRLYQDEACKQEVFVKQVKEGYQVVHTDALENMTSAKSVEMISNSKGEFKLYGLDGSTYYLKETSAPAGYRPLLDPIKIQVEPVVTEERNSYIKGEGAGADILTLSAKAKIKTFIAGSYTEKEISLDVDQEEGSMNLSVVNAVGKKLPVTGSQMMLLLVAAGVTLMFVSVRKGKKKYE